MLGFLDHEITEAFQYQMRRMGITLRLGEKVRQDRASTAPRARPATNGSAVRWCRRRSNRASTLRAQTLLYAVGRQGTTAALQLEKAGLVADDRERLKVNEHYQTAVAAHLRRRRRDRLPGPGQHRDGAGPAGGLPRLRRRRPSRSRSCSRTASTRSPRSRWSARPRSSSPRPASPTRPAIAQYKELARGQLLGDDTGMLKLLIHQENHQILGVHAIGTGATELIHIGQAVMAFNGTVDYFINNVFNFPTLAEAYKVAALNGLNKLRHV